MKMKQIINLMCVGIIFNAVLVGCGNSKRDVPVESYEVIPREENIETSEEDVTPPRHKIHEFKTISKNIE